MASDDGRAAHGRAVGALSAATLFVLAILAPAAHAVSASTATEKALTITKAERLSRPSILFRVPGTVARGTAIRQRFPHAGIVVVGARILPARN
jgi:hypothetical protein